MKIDFSQMIRILRTVGIIFLIYFAFDRGSKLLQVKLLERARTKRERTNIEVFFDTARYVLILLIIIFGILSYAGSLTGIGVVAGLMSAALGWALQRPITGAAAWLMLVIKRPFEIGDRVIIGGVKGDVEDITLTHVHIREIGGTIVSEERSGRLILIPNANLFDQNIINYTKKDELILDQVGFTITFTSDLKKAVEIGEKSARKVLKKYLQEIKEIYPRTYFQPSGVDVLIRYFCPAIERNKIASEITQEIFKEFKKTRKVRFAYPHTEVLISKRKD